jgi:alpha-glucoside transport system substrate-binding protein
MRRPAGTVAGALAAVLVALVASAGCTGPDDGGADLRGERLEVLATWTGTEQERFTRVLDAFERRTGATVSYVAAGDGLPELLRERLDAGDPPDVAFLPQPGLLRELAGQGHLVPLDGPVVEVVDAHFPRAFRQLATHEGHQYGVWFKAANKSLVWYDMATFERLGVVPPASLDGLAAAAERISQSGVPAFAVSGASPWTLTDWFENLYLRLAGPRAYDDLAAHRIPWTDPSVVSTLDAMSSLLAPQNLSGGVAGALDADFADSVLAVFGRPAAAAMVSEGDFVAGVATAVAGARLGVDADVFPFPAGRDGPVVVVGGGDVAVALRRTAAASQLLRFLATPEAAAPWAAAGGFLSPNLDLDLSLYPDEVTRSVARRLLEAGDGFRFDLSDLQPAAFGSSETAGMGPELRTFLLERDATATSRRLEEAATLSGAGSS